MSKPDSLAAALEAAREGVDESYSDRVRAKSSLSGALHQASLSGDDDGEVWLYPGVAQSIWRYQDHGPDQVRSMVQTAIDRKDYATTVEDAVEAFTEAVEHL